MSRPAWSRPVASRTGAATNRSISSATNPRYQASRAASICASRVGPTAAASSLRHVAARSGSRWLVVGTRPSGSHVAAELGQCSRKWCSTAAIADGTGGISGKPFSAYPRAGSRTSASGRVPWSRSSVSQPSHAPGTVAGSRPVPGIAARPSSSRRSAVVARCGATPCPHNTRGVGSPAVTNTAGTSPPGPHMCGSTTWRTNPPATTASNALPPRARTAIAVAVARWWVLAAAPWVPRRSYVRGAIPR